MTRTQAITTATKNAYARRASVRFGLDGNIYVGFIQGADMRCLYRLDASRGYLAVTMGQAEVPLKSLRITPLPEPEQRIGLE
jgi:hypothetical protein